MQKIKIGLSACLAGDEVRYNGQGCLDKLVMNELDEYFEYHKVCPEMAIGLGTPRETIRLVKVNDDIRLKASKSDNDFTDKMRDFAKADMERLKSLELSGFIFKKGSPSCGAYRVKIYDENGRPLMEKTAGAYALEFQKNFPYVPVEEDGRLNDAPLFENFIFRVFALSEWQEMLREGLSAQGIIKFHQRHKYALMAHDQLKQKELGTTISNLSGKDLNEVALKYLSDFMEILAKPPKRLHHANVLYHLLGYFKNEIDSFDKEESVKMIEQYRLGYVPLVVPVTRIAYFTKKYKQEYLLGQSYLEKPEKLGLLNKL